MLKTAVSSNDMIPVRNAIDKRAQDFLVDDYLLLPTLRAFTKSTGLLHVTRNA
jgi:hypothetical protein